MFNIVNNNKILKILMFLFYLFDLTKFRVLD